MAMLSGLPGGPVGYYGGQQLASFPRGLQDGYISVGVISDLYVSAAVCEFVSISCSSLYFSCMAF